VGGPSSSPVREAGPARTAARPAASIAARSDDLILHITFNSGLVDEESSHTDEPSGEYGHYHDYGRDFEQRFETAKRGLSILIVEMPDPVTSDATYPFSFLCRRRNDAETLSAAFDAEPAALVESFTPVPG
jgi:hypothetical protein